MRREFTLILLLMQLIIVACTKRSSTTTEQETTTSQTTTTQQTTTTTELVVDEDLVLWYNFNENTGDVIKDLTKNGNDGIAYNTTWYEAYDNKGALAFNGEDSYVELPNNILKDLDSITIVIDAFIDPESEIPFWLYTIGTHEDAGAYSNGSYLGLLNDSFNILRASVTKRRWEAEQNTSKNSSALKGVWTKFIFTYNGTLATLYEYDTSVARNANVTIKPSDLGETKYNYIGKPAYRADNYFKGSIKDFRIYKRALTFDEVRQLSIEESEKLIQLDYEALTIANANEITEKINLPLRGKYGSVIDWKSSDQNYVRNDGRVTRPPQGEKDKKVTLTATIKNGAYQLQKEFEVIVLAEYTDQKKLEIAASKIFIPNADNIRGNITLPEVGEFNTQITWTSTHPHIINTVTVPAAENDGYAPIPLGVVNRPDEDTLVKLTAKLTLNGHELEKEFLVTVKAKTKELTEDDYYAYLFVYFTGESTADGEQIYFATSLDGLHWSELNGNKPVLTSSVGEKGVRDPFIVRSPEGDKFYLIATDLRIYPRYDWGRASTAGSKSIVVWESSDLVNWFNERLVKINVDDAGCTWAPEVYYDYRTGEFLVYWSSKLGRLNYDQFRIYIAKTRDFYTFTAPSLYLQRERDVIDMTIIEHNGVYYRFYKDEVNKNILADKGTQLLNHTFTPVRYSTVESQPGVEGPEIFKLIGQDKWVLLVDNYGGKGYYPLITDSLESDFRVLPVSDYKMPQGARHGSVIRITRTEYEALMAKWGNK